jgi:hypothetical protein
MELRDPKEIVITDGDGKERTGPAVIGKHYTLSLSEKANLRADLEAWRGKMFTETELAGFDVKSVLGKPCQLGVVHKSVGGKTYANIAALMGAPKGIAKPIASGPLLHYDIDNHDQKVFDQLPGWLQTVIKDRVPEPGATVHEGGAVEPDFDDALPF